MGSAKYIGRVGGLAVALGVGMAVATTPGVAWADDTVSGVRRGPTDRGTPPAPMEPPNPKEHRPAPEPPLTPRAQLPPRVPRRTSASRPESGAVDTTTSGTSASTDALVRQAPPGMVNATGGAQTSKNVEQRHLSKGR